MVVDEGEEAGHWSEHLVSITMVRMVVIPLLGWVVLVTGICLMANPHDIPLVAVKTILAKGINYAGVPQVVSQRISKQTTAVVAMILVVVIWASVLVSRAMVITVVFPGAIVRVAEG